MDYPESSGPTTPFKADMYLDGTPDDLDLVRSGYVESRIRELNIRTSRNNLKAQSSPYVADTREDVTACSPVCQRTRLEVSASPPVGHSYPGLRVYDDHGEDNEVAWEVAATSSHRFNLKPSLRASRSANAVALQSPTRGPNRFRNSQKSNESAFNCADNARSISKSPMRSRANLRASLPPFQTVHEALDSSKKEQQDALDMFDMYGVSRPKGWLSSDREQQEAAGMKTVQVCHSCGGHLRTHARCARCGHEFCFKCRTELVSGLSTGLKAGRERGRDEQNSKQEAWRPGVTHSRSAANLSEPVLDRDRSIHRLSQSKSSDAVPSYLQGGRSGHTEGERQAHQQLRHERRQRLEKSHSEIASPQHHYDCPSCHVSSDRARHSICCIARQSQSGRQPVSQDNAGEDATYTSSSKDSFKSAHRRFEADEPAALAASVSSGYTTAEPFSAQRTERGILSERATVPPSSTYIPGIWHDKDRHSSSRRRMPRPSDPSTAHAQQAMEQDSFWIGSEGPGTSRRNIVPQSVESGNRDTPRLTLEGVELESESSRSSASAPSKAVWKTPATSRPISSYRDDEDKPERPQVCRYDEQTKNTREQQPQLSSGGGSPVRRDGNSSPETAKKSGGGGTLESRDSVNVTNAGKSPQQTIESSDPSTWKQRLRKLNDTPALGASSPRKEYPVSSPDSQRHIRQPPAARVPDSDPEMPVSHHSCEWRTRYLGLSYAFDKLKVELDEALIQQEGQRTADSESQRQRDNDDEIEGLTIIVHRKIRGDLVLNTDLKED